MNPFLPLWLKSLGLSLVTISVLTSIQAATRMFAPYAWGALSDRTGERARVDADGAPVLALIRVWRPVVERRLLVAGAGVVGRLSANQRHDAHD